MRHARLALEALAERVVFEIGSAIAALGLAKIGERINVGDVAFDVGRDGLLVELVQMECFLDEGEYVDARWCGGVDQLRYHVDRVALSQYVKGGEEAVRSVRGGALPEAQEGQCLRAIEGHCECGDVERWRGAHLELGDNAEVSCAGAAHCPEHVGGGLLGDSGSVDKA